MEEERKWCVYCHTNKINGKKYIGITSRNINTRWGKNGYNYLHYSYKFGGAVKKYGWDGFTHEILYSNLTENEAKWKEKFLIKYYDTFKHGYNNTLGGDGATGYIKTNKQLIKMRENHSFTTKIIQYDSNGNIIKKYNSIREASRLLDIDRKTILNSIRNKTIIKVGKLKGTIFIKEKDNFEIKKKDKKQRRSNIRITKYDIEGNILKEYHGLMECMLDNNIPDMSSLSSNLNGRSLTLHGNIYRKNDDCFYKYRIATEEEQYNKRIHIGIDHTGRKEIICENIRFITISNCAKLYKMSSSTIGQYLSNKKPMPQKWKDRGLRYYNPETDKDLPIYVDTKDEV